MSWIKFDTATPDKPEVWQIASDLGIDPDAVVGKLLRVWAWFDLHSETGNAPIVTKVTLDRHVGNAGFCDAMVRAGWMLDDGKLIGLPNFERHNGQTAKNRALTAQRVAKHKRSANGEGSGKVTASALPREEKRRSNTSSLRSEVLGPAPANGDGDDHRVDQPKAPRPAKRAPADFALTDDMRQWATDECPGVDIVAETAKFRDHTFATARSDWPATWRNWIRKAHENQRPATGGPHAATQPVRLTARDRAIADNERHRQQREGGGRVFDA